MPGTEAKDSYLPVGQVSGSWSLNENLALVGYYQYEWEKTQLNPVGDYLGSDTFGPGAEFFRLGNGAVDRLPNGLAVGYAGEKDASDSGQWGLGVRYRITENTEVGLFHYRYNERIGSMFCLYLTEEPVRDLATAQRSDRARSGDGRRRRGRDGEAEQHQAGER